MRGIRRPKVPLQASACHMHLDAAMHRVALINGGDTETHVLVRRIDTPDDTACEWCARLATWHLTTLEVIR